MANAHHTSFIHQEVISTSQSNALSTRLTAVESTNGTQQTAINLNTAKVGTPFTISGTDVYVGNNQMGINNPTPNCDLEIGNGTDVASLRLNGLNSQNLSSEIIFTDSYVANDSSTNYGQGASIRWNSASNRLEFLTDQGDDGSPEIAGYLTRNVNPEWTFDRLNMISSFKVNYVDLTPESRFLYATRIKRIDNSDSDTFVQIPNTEVTISWLNSVQSNITNNETTGLIGISVAGFYHIKAILSLATTASQRRVELNMLTSTGSLIATAVDHLSREESATSYGMIQLNLFRYLPIGSYKFTTECDNDGAGSVLNSAYDATTLVIKGMPIPNGYTIPTNYPNS